VETGFAIQMAGSVSNPDPIDTHVDHVHKNTKQWNSAGTFRLLLTLKKACADVKAAQKNCAVELARRL